MAFIRRWTRPLHIRRRQTNSRGNWLTYFTPGKKRAVLILSSSRHRRTFLGELRPLLGKEVEGYLKASVPKDLIHFEGDEFPPSGLTHPSSWRSRCDQRSLNDAAADWR